MDKKALTSGFVAGITAISTLVSVVPQQASVYRSGGLRSDFAKVGNDIRNAINERTLNNKDKRV